jgi:hypothetical protein
LERKRVVRLQNFLWSIVERTIADENPQATAMAEHLDEPERIAVSEILRDSADLIERRQFERV